MNVPSPSQEAQPGSRASGPLSLGGGLNDSGAGVNLPPDPFQVGEGQAACKGPATCIICALLLKRLHYPLPSGSSRLARPCRGTEAVGAFLGPSPCPRTSQLCMFPGSQGSPGWAPALADLEAKGRRSRVSGPGPLVGRARESGRKWGPGHPPPQAVTLSIWRGETSLCPFSVTQGPRGQLPGGDACLICLAGAAFPLLLRFAPSGSDSLCYWLIFHPASVVTRPGNGQQRDAAP